MDTLILYASKYGCTGDCAVEVKSKLSEDATLVDIQNNSTQIDLQQYDTVIIGSPIYIGAIPKAMQKFCADNVDVLKKKKLGVFLCCATPGQAEEYFKSNFPEALIKSAKVVKVFGGEIRLEKMKLMDKLIAKAATKGNPQSVQILRDYLHEFVRHYLLDEEEHE